MRILYILCYIVSYLYSDSLHRNGGEIPPSFYVFQMFHILCYIVLYICILTAYIPAVEVVKLYMYSDCLHTCSGVQASSTCSKHSDCGTTGACVGGRYASMCTYIIFIYMHIPLHVRIHIHIHMRRHIHIFIRMQIVGLPALFNSHLRTGSDFQCPIPDDQNHPATKVHVFGLLISSYQQN